MKPVPAQQWCFSALDTLFFKESRPMDAVGGAELQSAFPPPARTLIGAIRSAIGTAHEVDWSAYGREVNHPLKAIMGSADSLGPLSFTGPFLLRAEKRLFPVPLALLHAKEKGKEKGIEIEIDKFTRLKPSSVVTSSDLGAVQLPQKTDALAGAKPLENAWITAEGLQAFLDGKLPKFANTIFKTDTLYDSEERLGIGRNNATGTVIKGLLYQTRHVRPKSDVSVGIVMQGLNSSLIANQGVTRLGGEGRLVGWRSAPVAPLPQVTIKTKKVMLVLLTHARFKHGWLPDGFTEVARTRAGQPPQTVWEGVLHGVSLRLISCVVGKPLREGGWDLVNQTPRSMESLVPAGSCYFCEVLGDVHAKTLHGKQIGQDTEYGRGEIAVGNW